MNIYICICMYIYIHTYPHVYIYDSGRLNRVPYCIASGLRMTDDWCPLPSAPHPLPPLPYPLPPTPYPLPALLAIDLRCQARREHLQR